MRKDFLCQQNYLVFIENERTGGGSAKLLETKGVSGL